MGSTLNDSLVIRFIDGHGDWRPQTRWANRARRLWHQSLPPGPRRIPTNPLDGHILMTWERSTPRYDEMLHPVLERFERGHCVVFYGRPDVKLAAPLGTPTIGWSDAMSYGLGPWRAEYQRCRPEWHGRLSDLCRRFDLPDGSSEGLSLDLLLASQRVAGCLQFLKRNRPSVILTEYDRNYLWSCLVLAARTMQIPTVTLVHGVMERDPIGFTPVLADLILAWGELDRDKLVAAGEPAGKVVIGGCPRLTRDLPVTVAEGRARLGLDPLGPVVMFATSPELRCLPLVEMFCETVESMSSFAGVVRLHPSDRLETYKAITQRHPSVLFTRHSDATLDESLAAADVVVVRGSGVGSDALVKRRPVVVINSEETLSGHDWDLVERAGCPHARTSSELADVLGRLLCDETFRRQRATAAERYVAGFCAAFGEESAIRIADIVEQAAARPDA